MRKKVTIALLLALSLTVFAQYKTATDFGLHHIQIKYKSDKVDILIESKGGEDEIKKPLFFFCQGSLPVPVMKHNKETLYAPLPFDYQSLIAKYHLVIVSKPCIPFIMDVKNLTPGFTYIDSTGMYPKAYSDRNLLDYYVDRNLEVIKYLQKQKWVSKKELVVAGHSEGSTVAAKMAFKSRKITHLIYLSGNPLGRILSMIQQQRANETDSTKSGENMFEYWKDVVDNKNDMKYEGGDTYKATYVFSYPTIEHLNALKIPVFVGYGTKDWCAPFNDYMRVDFMRKGKNNFQFNAYIGAEHNFNPVVVENKVTKNTCSWDRVANDWMKWLEQK